MRVNDAHGSLHGVIVHIGLLVRRLRIGPRLVDLNIVGIGHLLCVDGRDVSGRSGQLLLHGDLLVIFIIGAAAALVLYAFRLEALRIVLEIAIIIDGRGHTMQLEAYTRRAGPCIRRRRITLDLPPSTPLARSHHYTSSAPAQTLPGRGAYPSSVYGDCAHRQRHNLRTH